MRLCPSCGNRYEDEANFCPLDATRLPPATTGEPPRVAVPTFAPTNPESPRPFNGRFAITGPEVKTPTGVVAEANDLEQGGAVLVKRVDPAALPNGAAIDRAVRELKQLAKVSSERIVRIVDHGRTEDGQLYIVTELVTGPTLEELVARQGPLELERARAIVLAAGEALVEAQKVGVIHRDVAPRNIVVEEGDRVKVVDFALAEPAGEQRFGTPAYLSPEQVEGKAVDQRSNIYSLAAVLYFALIGSPPFEGEASELLQKQLHATPPVPSLRCPGLPPEIDRLIAKALEKSGGRRHLTLRQMLTELKGPSDPIAGSPQKPPTVRTARTVMGMPAPVLGPAVAAPSIAAPSIATGEPAAPAETPSIVVASTRQPPGAAASAADSEPGAAARSASKRVGSETGWFKRGELEQQRARAEAAHASVDPLAKSGWTGKNAPIDAPVQVTAEDHARWSLKTGHTQVLPTVRAGAALTGERMDESEMLSELIPSKRRFIVAGAIAAMLLLGAAYALCGRGRPAHPVADSRVAATASSGSGAAAAPAAAPTAAAAPAEHPLDAARKAATAEAARSNPSRLLASAIAEGRKNRYAPAIALVHEAAERGAAPPQIKKTTAVLARGLQTKLARAERRHDRPGAAEARRLLARLSLAARRGRPSASGRR